MMTLTPEEVSGLLDTIYPGEEPRDASIALVVSILLAADIDNDDVEDFFDDIRECYDQAQAQMPGREN